MIKRFSQYLETKHNILKELVTKLSKKFEYVSILASDSEGKVYKVSEKNVTIKDSSWQERGFVVRVFNAGLYSEYAFDDIGDDIKEIYEKIINSVDVKDQLYKAIYAKKKVDKLYREEELIKCFSRLGEYDDVSSEEVISRCKKLIANSMEDNEYIIAAHCTVEYLKISKMFISLKKDLKQVYTWANANYHCIVNKDEITKFNYCGESDISLEDAICKMEKKAKSVNDDATSLLYSTHIEPGEYDCITTPEISGLIAHEAFGHGVEMDMFVKNRALGAKYINQSVGSSLVEMHEGAIPFKDVSSYYFDDEGVLAQDTKEIDKGVLLTGIADAITASKLNIKPTGNGKRENYRHKAYTRMTSTYFSPKGNTLDEMIRSIQKGYLVTGELSGMEDPKNWGIQCIALIGKEILNGRLTGKVVSPLVITGNVLDLLNSVTMVSKDFELYGSGACGKGYKEWVKTAVGGPYLKVRMKLG